mgnify:CR=1 FL=1
MTPTQPLHSFVPPRAPRAGWAWLRPVLLYSATLILLFWTLAPVLWIGIMSVQPEINYVSVPPRLSLNDFSLRWFAAMLAEADFLNSLITSLIVASVTMFICLFLGALAAYPLARLNVPHKNLFLALSVIGRMIPAMVLIIPMFLLLRNLRLLDQYLGLIIVYSTFLLPYVIWMLKNFFEQVPPALESAARMDGCSRLGSLFRVMIPVTAPGIVATAIFAFIGAWNEFLFGLILSTNRAVPVTVRLSALVSTTFHSDTSLVAAAGMLTLIPPVLLVFILNRFIIRGLVEGVKF